MGPGTDCRKNLRSQGKPARLGPRLCLLKDCDRWFHPRHHSQRYCGQTCVELAKSWCELLAQRKYRSSDGGKACRCEQARRQRLKIRLQRERVESRATEQQVSATQDTSVGHPHVIPEGFCPCHRPGCYVLFARSDRSPLQCFCSPLCRQALRRVLLREARWRRRRRHRPPAGALSPLPT